MNDETNPIFFPITFPQFNEEEIALLQQCLSSGWVTQGPMVAKFEELVAKLQSVEYALATTSCTAALHMAIAALGVGPGDEVIVPAFTWVTSAHCAEYMGATVVFVDVDPFTYNIDVAALESAITPQTRAIVAVHLFGLAADMNEITDIANRHDISVVEDAACALGTEYKGKPVGGLGDIGCFSFHPRKVVTTGEGGMVTTNNEAIAQTVQSLRNHGATGIEANVEEPFGPWTMTTFNKLGFNLRLSDIQAAVGVAQLGKFQVLLAGRRGVAKHYSHLLSESEELSVPLPEHSQGHSFQSYVIRVLTGGRQRRNDIMSALQKIGAQTRPGTHAVHRLGYYREKYSLEESAFPNAAMCEDTTITLPLFPSMTESQVESIAAELKRALEATR